MFQSFDALTDPSQGVDRVARLRAHLSGLGLDGFLVPRADEHQGEYVPARAERLRWLTGFTGSAGAALVLRERALIFVDGRYTLQAAAQVDTGTFEVESLIDNPPSKWLAAHADAGFALGFDPWLHTVAEVEALRAMGLARGGSMHRGAVSVELGDPGIPAEAEESYIERDLRLAEETGGWLHVCHVSTARGAGRCAAEDEARPTNSSSPAPTQWRSARVGSMVRALT